MNSTNSPKMENLSVRLVAKVKLLFNIELLKVDSERPQISIYDVSTNNLITTVSAFEKKELDIGSYYIKLSASKITVFKLRCDLE